MEGRFIYVFSIEAYEKLLLMGYKPLKSDENQSVYIFENQDKLVFSTDEIECVRSDTLTF
jgi:hypothetical protein